MNAIKYDKRVKNIKVSYFDVSSNRDLTNRKFDNLTTQVEKRCSSLPDDSNNLSAFKILNKK